MSSALAPGSLRARVAGCGLLVFIGLGLLGTFAIAVDWLQGLETWSWQETTCTISASEVIARPEYGDYLFDVEYSFRWRGVERHGSTYGVDYFGSEENDARILASRYAPGSRERCFVDPDDPGRSTLVRSNLWEGLWILLPLLFVAVGGGALWLLRSTSPVSTPATNTTTPDRSQVFSRLRKPAAEGIRPFKKVAATVGFFAVFFLFGAGIFIPFFVWPALKVIEARSWTKVPCEILESSVLTHSGDDGDTYSIQVLYRYEVDGRELLSDRYHFLSGSSGGYEGKAEVVEGLPPGTETVCYVDPEDPHSAVLQRDFSGEFLFGLIPMIFVLVGVGGMFAVIATARNARKAASGPTWVSSAIREEPNRRRGTVTLEPTMGPVGKLGAAIFFGLVWNGLVSVFVWILIDSWKRGDFDWFVAIVLTPFVIIGLLLLAAIPMSLLALSNPRPRLRLSREILRPGESAQIEWSFRGAARRIRQLTIELQAVQAGKTSSDSKGTPRSSSVEPLLTIEIAKRRRGMGLEYGSGSLTIPPNAMNLPGAESHEITWKLVFHGEIAFWPDVREEYELTVLDQ